MQPSDTKKRIVLLDSFRCLAILFVICFHYTYRWTQPYFETNLYPYKNFYGSIFKYGYLGVSFFFIISGFVISFTLEGTEKINAFFKNRFIRLFPPMLLCTLVTFIGVHFLDREIFFTSLHDPKNFLPSLTFITPTLYERIFNYKFDWLNGSYWSLWVEIQFYIISAIVYFANRKKYFTNIIITCLVILLAGKLLKNVCCGGNTLHIPFPDAFKSQISFWVDSVFNITTYIQFFAAGVIFHKLYKDSKLYSKTSVILAALTFVTSFMYVKSVVEAVFLICMYVLFWLMIYRPHILGFLNNRVFIRIGVLSYTIYLIHEPIAILAIQHFGAYFGILSPLVPWILMLLVYLFAELSYRFYEKNVYRYLKKVLFKQPVQKAKPLATSI